MVRKSSPGRVSLFVFRVFQLERGGVNIFCIPYRPINLSDPPAPLPHTHTDTQEYDVFEIYMKVCMCVDCNNVLSSLSSVCVCACVCVCVCVCVFCACLQVTIYIVPDYICALMCVRVYVCVCVCECVCVCG